MSATDLALANDDTVPLLGRDFERSCFDRALTGARSGAGGLLLIRGSPGAGKTRLLNEFVSLASEAGVRALLGGSRETAPEPYALWIDLLRDMLDRSDRDDDALRTDRQAVRVALKSLSSPDIGDAALIGRLIAALGLLDQSTPTLLALDDLDRADESSLRLLSDLSGQATSRPFLAVGAFSSGFADLRNNASVLRSLVRRATFGTVVLGSWSREEAHAYLESRTQGSDGLCELFARLYALSGGSPGYLAQLAEGLPVDETDPDVVSRHLRMVVHQRLGHVSTDCAEVLRFGALLGQEISLSALDAVLPDHGTLRLVELVEEAIEWGLLGDSSRGGGYTFRESTVRDAILEGMSVARRAYLHGLIAERLDARHAGDTVFEPSIVAYHLHEAAKLSSVYVDRALEYALLSAEQAESGMAWLDAAGHYEHVLELLSPAGRADREGEVLTALGRCQRNGGEMRTAWRTLQRATDWYLNHGDASGAVEATLRATRIPAPPHRHRRMLEEALSRLPEESLAASRARGDLLVQIALSDHFAPDEAERALVEAIRVNEGEHCFVLGARIRFAEALHAYRRSLRTGRYDASVAIDLLAAHRNLNEAGAVLDAFRALGRAGVYEARWGHLARAQELLQQAFEHQRRVQIEVDQLCPTVVLASLAWLRGDFANSLRLAEHLNPAIIDSHLLPMLGADFRGHSERAIELMPEISVAADIPVVLAHLLAARARVWANSGRYEEARRELETWNDLTAHRSDPERGAAVAELADVIVTVADDEFVANAYRVAAASPLRWNLNVGASGDRGRGELALRLGLIEEAEAHFQGGLAWCEEYRLPLEAAWCRLGLASVEHARGNVRAAADHLQSADDLFRDLGVVRGQQRAESTRQRWGADARQQGAPAGLTARELSVLRLLARGNTNDEIADELSISPNTVANHIRNIREKTNTANRTQAAAFAFRLGLAN